MHGRGTIWNDGLRPGIASIQVRGKVGSELFSNVGSGLGLDSDLEVNIFDIFARVVSEGVGASEKCC